MFNFVQVEDFEKRKPVPVSYFIKLEKCSIKEKQKSSKEDRSLYIHYKNLELIKKNKNKKGNGIEYILINIIKGNE